MIGKLSSIDQSNSHLNSACFDRKSFKRSASASSVMTSATATSVFNQTDGDADLIRAKGTQNDVGR